ncbi:MAG: hypothetical protein R3F61_14860 [Myxococcota bacterium]
MHLLWSDLTRLLVDDRPLDEGLETADSVVFALDDLFEECLEAAHRGGPELLLQRAGELVRMKQRVYGLLDRYVAEATGGVVLADVARRARDGIQHSRMLLAHAREVRITVLAS